MRSSSRCVEILTCLIQLISLLAYLQEYDDEGAHWFDETELQGSLFAESQKSDSVRGS